MNIHLRKVQENDLLGFNEALNEVCAERKYLASINGFSIEMHWDFLCEVLLRGAPQIVALNDSKIIGWCDIRPRELEGFTHVGRLGMGVKKAYRRLGIGELLLDECLRDARSGGIEKVELEVFSDNIPAVQLYRKHGFLEEGRKIKARKLDGNYQDIILMGLQLQSFQVKNRGCCGSIG